MDASQPPVPFGDLVSLVERTNDLFYVVRPDGTVSYISPQIRRYGLEPDAIVGCSLLDFIHPDDRDTVARDFQRTMEDGDEFPAEFRVPLPDGQVIWLEDYGQVQTGPDGRPSALVGMLRDVTARKRAEQELRESQSRYEALVEQSLDGVGIVRDGKVLFTNSTAAELLGYTIEEILAMEDFRDVFEPESREAVIELQARRRAGLDAPQFYEARVRCKDGTIKDLEISARPIRYQGAPAVLGTFRDITWRKRTEQALRRAHARLVRARDQERQDLARRLHDTLAQQLIAMQLRLQAARAEAADAKLSGLLEEIAETCSSVIRDLRHISTGLYPPALETLGLRPALAQLVSQCPEEAAEIDLQFEEPLRQTRLPIDVESTFFHVAREALANVLEHAQATRATVSVRSFGPAVLLDVQDNGKGFAPSPDNEGLGLTSMRERADAIGARLSIASAPGETTVRLTWSPEPASEPIPPL